MTKIERAAKKERIKALNDWVSINSIKYPDMETITGNGGVHWRITFGKVRFDIWPSTQRCTKSTPVGDTDIAGEVKIMQALEIYLEVYDVQKG